MKNHEVPDTWDGIISIILHFDLYNLIFLGGDGGNRTRVWQIPLSTFTKVGGLKSCYCP